MKPASVLLFLCMPFTASGQFTEDFSDGDFSQGPVWTGDTAYWQVNNGKLQSRFTEAGKAVFHLSTRSSAVQSTSWEFWTQLHFNTSRNNYVEVYLVSDREDPRCEDSTCEKATGYFVRIGNTTDNISLYRRDSAGEVLLISGRPGITDKSNNILKIKVVCDSSYQWTLFDDPGGTGNDYLPEGKARDSTYRKSAFFSIVVFQSGSTAVEKHFFDDIIVGPFIPDNIPPAIQEIFPQDEHHISLLFTESLAPASAEDLLNYKADGGLVMPDSATLDKNNRRLVHLYFENEIQARKTYQLEISQIRDLYGNAMDTTVSFLYSVPHQYEVIIDEIFPDPTPSKGLPEYEYVELKNISPYPLNLEGWKFCDPTACAVIPPVMLHPDSLLILCDQQAADLFHSFGTTIGLSHFPSLNNSGDVLTLYDKWGNIIHGVAYSADWYGDPEKKNGGWSLEMKDTRFPCIGADNWTASTATRGGTPGTINTAEVSYPENPFLRLEHVNVLDSAHLLAHFNTGVDSLSAAQVSRYFINDIPVDSAFPQGPLFQSVQLHLAAPLQKRKIYFLKINALKGCGNIVQGIEDEARFGLPETADHQDVVINEILFNPKTGSHDFIELFNRSPKIIDAAALQTANRNPAGQAAAIKEISAHPRYLFPKDYLALTVDKKDLLVQYDCKIPENILQVDALPQFPNTGGTALLLDTSGHMIDEVNYSEKAQSAFFHNNKGVSLERIDANGESEDAANWHSASSVAGYATPGYLNSQATANDTLEKAFSVTPGIFSPDNDGVDDQAFIRYRLPAGYSGKVIIFNAGGQPVRHLSTNAVLGTHGSLVWDGRNDALQVLPTGMYVIYIQIFNSRGEVRQYKLPVVLAKRR